MANEHGDVSDEELEAVALRVRAHRRRTLMAKLAGSGIAFFGLVAGFAASAVLTSMDLESLGRRAFWIVWVIFVVAGAFAYKTLEPKQHVDDLE